MAFRRSGVRPSLAPPRFLTNLGIPAEDIRKQAGHRPAFLVFGKRAKSDRDKANAALKAGAFADGNW